MTVVAAACWQGEVWMSCDSENLDSSGRSWPNARKVLALPVGLPDPAAAVALLGHAGTTAVHERLRRRLDASALPSDRDDDAWADALARVLDGLAREEPTLAKDGEVESRWLLGRAGRLWLVEEGYAQPLGRYSAIGSGGDVALGVLYGRLEDADDLRQQDVRGAVVVAARAALRFDDGCRGEVLVHALPAAGGAPA